MDVDDSGASQELDKFFEIMSFNVANFTKLSKGMSEAIVAKGYVNSATYLEEAIELQERNLKRRTEELCSQLRELKLKRKETSNDLKETARLITECRKEIVDLKSGIKENNLSFKAYKCALPYYTRHFNFTIDLESIEEQQYTAVVRFKVNNEIIDVPIRMVIDGASGKIRACDTSALSTSEELFQSDDDPPVVFYKLREAVLKRNQLKM